MKRLSSMPHIHDNESDAPQSAAHQAHSNQTGNKKVNVAATGLVQFSIAGGGNIPPAGRALESIVHGIPGQETFGARGIVEILIMRTVAGDHNEVGLAGSQPQLAGFGIAALHLELGDRGQGFSRAFGV
jgi:hypothetical protein